MPPPSPKVEKVQMAPPKLPTPPVEKQSKPAPAPVTTSKLNAKQFYYKYDHNTGKHVLVSETDGLLDMNRDYKTQGFGDNFKPVHTENRNEVQDLRFSQEFLRRSQDGSRFVNPNERVVVPQNPYYTQ